ncbi:hypothetical protein COLINT_02050 [Collinsella intestinalis DSM 13280]|uniref:Uncharacterized protein n=1 Tax=Collinsella intestinalis DSM 13280 TaxID=521003 RepID=C4F7N5_9ACTN|nr:hypothetical protein COLINT_02050 [Collinsella intestinalis DSM 13280]
MRAELATDLIWSCPSRHSVAAGFEHAFMGKLVSHPERTTGPLPGCDFEIK